MSKQEIDQEFGYFHSLKAEQELVRGNRIPGVRTVLVVLSSLGMVYDVESLRQRILLSYPDAAVFFVCTSGSPIGVAVPHEVDLLIDFTGRGERQCFWLARRFRRKARVAVGRNAGILRRRIYDRVFDADGEFGSSPESLAREGHVQREVLRLAGVAFTQSGETQPDRSKMVPLELPLMQKL